MRERENHRIWFCIKIYNKDAIPCRFYAKPLVNPLFSFDLFNWSIQDQMDRLHCMKYSPVVSFHVTLTPLNSECWSQKRIEIKRTRTIAKRRENATQKLNESNSTVFKWYPNAYVLETENDNNFAVSNLKEQKLIKVSNDIAE